MLHFAHLLRLSFTFLEIEFILMLAASDTFRNVFDACCDHDVCFPVQLKFKGFRHTVVTQVEQVSSLT